MLAVTWRPHGITHPETAYVTATSLVPIKSLHGNVHEVHHTQDKLACCMLHVLCCNDQ